MHLFRQPLVFIVFAFVLFLFATDVDAASLTLEWDPPVDGITVGYIVLYGTAAGVYSARVDVGAVTTFRIDGLADATQYFFSVQAYGARGEVSAPAAEVSGFTPSIGGGPIGAEIPPGPPEQFTHHLTGELLTLSWEPPAGGETASRYLIEAMTPFGPLAYEVGDASTFTHWKTPPGRYDVAVRAGNAAGFGPPSAVVTIFVP